MSIFYLPWKYFTLEFTFQILMLRMNLIGQHFFSRSLLLFEEVLELEVTDDEAAKTAGPKEI